MTTGPMVDTVTATTTGLSAGTWRPQPPRTRAAATATATGWLKRLQHLCRAATAGCYGGPACDEAFKAGNIGSKHGCCDCGEVTETACTAGAGVSWYAQCGTGLCLPDWRNPLMDSGPKCGDDGFEKYDNIKAALDEMKQGC